MDDIVFIGDWVKDRILGSGSFGTVVLWKHKRTEENLAIKTCKWGDELTEKHKERWTKEVEMLQNCRHPNIVRTKELPSEFVSGLLKANPSKLPILCMEYCSGGDLRQLLNKPESCSGLKENIIRQLLFDIKNAIEFLHDNKITHRDLKPENIVTHVEESHCGSSISSQRQQKVSFKLIDLGFAKEIDSKSVCASFVGTLQYLAPEILYSKTYSNSVDYWSFGLLAFEMICGTRPFLPFMPPVQWMPHVKTKKYEHICVYETFHGDIESSSEIFAENHVSKPLKGMIEKWLRIALQWDPKTRGRDSPSKVTFNLPSENQEESRKVVIFTMLEDILKRKVIKIFSVPTLSTLAYEINESTTLATLKDKICLDTNIQAKEQLIFSAMNYVETQNQELAVAYWNENNNCTLFLFNKNYITKDSIEPTVPIAVKRCLEHPKALYNYKNSRNLYRAALFFVMNQMEILDSLINSLILRTEILKNESKQLLLKHNTVDKELCKLIAKQEALDSVITLGNKHIAHLKENGKTHFLGGFEKTFKDAEDLSDKSEKLQLAWNQLCVRLQSAARRSNEVLLTDLTKFVTKYNFNALYTNAVKAYIMYMKSEHYSENRSKDKQCHEIVKICYDCLKLRSKILADLQNQPFILKIMDLSMEFAKISEVITTAAENMTKLLFSCNSISEALNNCIWNTISIVVSDTDNLADLPYSVISFQKSDFDVGGHTSHYNGHLQSNGDVKSLIHESIKIKHNNLQLAEKIKSQKQQINNIAIDFSFLNGE